MTSKHIDLKLPSPQGESPRTIKIGSEEFTISSPELTSSGNNGAETIKRLEEGLRDGAFAGLINKDYGEGD